MTDMHTEAKRAKRSEIVGIGSYAAIALGVQMLGDAEVVAVFERITLPAAVIIAALLIKDGLHFRMVHRHILDYRKLRRRARAPGWDDATQPSSTRYGDTDPMSKPPGRAERDWFDSTQPLPGNDDDDTDVNPLDTGAFRVPDFWGDDQ